MYWLCFMHFLIYIFIFTFFLFKKHVIRVVCLQKTFTKRQPLCTLPLNLPLGVQCVCVCVCVCVCAATLLGLHYYLTSTEVSKKKMRNEISLTFKIFGFLNIFSWYWIWMLSFFIWKVATIQEMLEIYWMSKIASRRKSQNVLTHWWLSWMSGSILRQLRILFYLGCNF